MPLSRLAGVSNFCCNSLLPFLSIVCILSFQAISFQILLYALFPQFSWSILLFPSYFNFHNLTYLGIDVATHDMTIPLQRAFNYHTLNLYNNTHLITKNLSGDPINQSHPVHHLHHPDMTLCPMQSHLIHKSKCPRFTTVQQSWSIQH